MTIEVQADQDVQRYLEEHGAAGEIEVEVDPEAYRFLEKQYSNAPRKLAKGRAETPEITQARQQMQAHVAHFLTKTAREIADAIRKLPDHEKLAKAVPKIPPITWDALVPDVAGSLTTIARAGGKQALAELKVSDSGMLSDVNEVAADWAEDRAAELVGMRRLK